MPDHNSPEGDEASPPRLGPVRQRTRPSTRTYGPAALPSSSHSHPAHSGPSTSSVGAEPGSDYDVGYGKPPKHTQFKVGRSGNPRGRPKGAKGLNTITRELMTQKVRVRTASGETRMSRIESVYQKTHELAMKGSLPAIVELFRRYAAAVPDSVLSDNSAMSEEDLDAADQLILAALRADRNMPEGDGS